MLQRIAFLNVLTSAIPQGELDYRGCLAEWLVAPYQLEFFDSLWWLKNRAQRILRDAQISPRNGGVVEIDAEKKREQADHQPNAVRVGVTKYRGDSALF